MSEGGKKVLELYQNEACPECGRVRRRLAELGLACVIRTVPMDRARRERVIEAGGRPDIPLLLDPERGRTTYDADEIAEVLGSLDFFGADATVEEGLPELFEREGEAPSDEARRILDLAGLDHVLRPAGPADPRVPRLLEPASRLERRGAAAIRDWAGSFHVRARD